jgi:meiotically up-regulated gene 157 (Mug157) protein
MSPLLALSHVYLAWAGQVAPYLRFAKTDANATALIKGVIKRCGLIHVHTTRLARLTDVSSLLDVRQAIFVALDPYANSFKLDNSALSPNYQDSTSKLGSAACPEVMITQW